MAVSICLPRVPLLFPVLFFTLFIPPHLMEKTRYSDAELEEFRLLIHEKLRVAEEQYREILDTMAKRNSNDIDDTLPTYHSLEEGAPRGVRAPSMPSARHPGAAPPGPVRGGTARASP